MRSLFQGYRQLYCRYPPIVPVDFHLAAKIDGWYYPQLFHKSCELFLPFGVWVYYHASHIILHQGASVSPDLHSR